MLGTKALGRSVIFGLGYVAGTRAGRERYEQLRSGAVTLAGQLRQRLDEMPDTSPASVADAARRAWDDSDITLGRS
ncbi:hypothetical protein GCM10009623_31600 [Nocardioides aestuarii]|uniref:YtxH domain-containing protein n=1 Tax=Nocardioides aestuarii TaxID=252231 RepID=A0ABW4TP26_9ACTN